MIRARLLVLVALAGACVQTGSVGSDTGRSAGTDAGSASTTENPDPYAICRDVETTGEPFPDSCAASPADSQCLQCIKLVCCSELVACPSYTACVCHIDCAAADGSPDVCTEACAGDEGGCDLSDCGALECEQVCVG